MTSAEESPAEESPEDSTSNFQTDNLARRRAAAFNQVESRQRDFLNRRRLIRVDCGRLLDFLTQFYGRPRAGRFFWPALPPGLPDDLTFIACHSNPWMRMIEIEVCSWSFSPVEDGQETPVLDTAISPGGLMDLLVIEATVAGDNSFVLRPSDARPWAKGENLDTA